MAAQVAQMGYSVQVLVVVVHLPLVDHLVQDRLLVMAVTEQPPAFQAHL